MNKPRELDDLITRLRDEAGLCRNETAYDVARLLDEAADALEALQGERDRALKFNIEYLKSNNGLASANADLVAGRDAERLKRQQVEHERDSILEDLAGMQSRLDAVKNDVYCIYQTLRHGKPTQDNGLELNLARIISHLVDAAQEQKRE